MTDRDELIKAVKTIQEFCQSHGREGDALMCKVCGLYEFCHNESDRLRHSAINTICKDLIEEISSDKFLKDRVPFYLNGQDVLCMNCRHLGRYDVILDELHHTDIFIGWCLKGDRFVGLPLDECGDFEKRGEE